MAFAHAVAALVALAAMSFASPASAFVVGGPLRVRSTTPADASSRITHVSSARRSQQGVVGLRAAASDEEGEGGFVNPYTAFRKWQLDTTRSKAENNEKYPEAVAGLMKEEGMTREKAERLARIAVSDPILYAIERRAEANKINNTPMDYDKIGGFFPMEWIMSGDFGWGFNKKKRRLAEEQKNKSGK